MANAWLSGFTTAQNVTVFALAGSDSIRGGSEVVISAPTLAVLDAGQDQSFQQLTAVPAGWTETGAGDQNYEFAFTELVTPATPGTAGLQHSSALTHFDAAIDFVAVQPQAVRGQQGLVDVAIFRFDVTSIAIPASLIVQVERGPDARLLVRATVSAWGRTFFGTATLVTSPRFTLRIVRNGAHIWAYIGQRRRDRVYTSSTQLIGTSQFVTAAGNLGIRVDNRARNIRVKSRITNFTVESHARINDRLLEDKQIRFSRVIGVVPAAPLEEVGTAELAVFGLFGESISSQGFEYTLPTPRTVGQQQSTVLRFYQDPQHRDGDT